MTRRPVCLLAFVLALPCAAQSLFSPPLIDALGSQASADMDGDGIRDLLYTAFTTNKPELQIRYGRADGGFDAAVEIANPLWVQELQVADLDGDEQLDIVVHNNDASFVVLLADGDGGFVPQTVVTVPRAALGFAFGDVDGDEDLDLVANLIGVPGGPYGSVATLLNDGEGGLAAPVVTDSGYFQHLLVQRVDGDARADLILSGGSIPRLVTMPSNGDGSFAAQVVLPLSGPQNTTVIGYIDGGDVDRDGDMDLVGSTSNGLEVWLNADDAFAAPIVLTGSRKDQSPVLLVDLAPGNRLSIFTGSYELPAALFVGTPTGWNPAYALPSTQQTNWLPIRVASDATTGEHVMQSTVYGTVEYSPDGAGGLRVDRVMLNETHNSGLHNVAVGDLDGDGDDDFVTGTGPGLNYFLNDGVGNFVRKTFMPDGSSVPPVTWTLYSGIVAVGDADGDKRADVFVPNGGVNCCVVFWDPANLDLRTRLNLTLQPGITDAMFADLDRDGREELITAGMDGMAASARVYKFSATRAVSSVTIALGNGRPKGLTSGDFDADGDGDVALMFEDLAKVTVLRNDGGAAVFTPMSVPLSVPDWSVRDLVAGDVDADGDDDLVYSAYSDTAVLLAQGGGFVPGNSLHVGNAVPTTMHAFDFDGDLDIDFAMDEDGNDFFVALNDGTGQFSLTGQFLGVPRITGMAQGDFNGDHRRDLLIAAMDSTEIQAVLGDPTRPRYNRAPMARNSSATLNLSLGGTVSGSLSATDPDHDALTYAITQVSTGTITAFNPATGAYTWLAPAGYSGSATVKFTANDGEYTSAVGTLTIAVTSASVDLKVVATNPPGTMRPNSNMAFKFTVTALTAKVSTSRVSVTALVPATTSFVSASIPGGSCALVGNRVTCTQSGVLAAKGKVIGSMTFKASVKGVVAFSPTVSAMTRDPLPKNNTHTVKKTVAK